MIDIKSMEGGGGQGGGIERAGRARHFTQCCRGQLDRPADVRQRKHSVTVCTTVDYPLKSGNEVYAVKY